MARLIKNGTLRLTDLLDKHCILIGPKRVLYICKFCETCVFVNLTITITVIHVDVSLNLRQLTTAVGRTEESEKQPV